jgi:energy-converting hydrogenase Eha subunit E
MAADTPVTQISELFMTTEGLLAVLGALSTTVLPDDVDTVFELLLTVLETVDEVTVSVALAGSADRTAHKAVNATTVAALMKHLFNIAKGPKPP